MTPRKKLKPDDKEQSARFIEKAKQTEEPGAKEAFEEALNKIAKKKDGPKTQPRLSPGES